MDWTEYPRVFYPSVLHVDLPPTPKNLTIYNPTTGLTNLLFNFPEEPSTDPYTDFETIVVICSAISSSSLGIYFGPDSPHNLSVDISNDPPHNLSNLAAELFAVHKAFKLARTIANVFGPEHICIMKIVVVTSCEAVVTVITELMEEWSDEEWEDEEWDDETWDGETWDGETWGGEGSSDIDRYFEESPGNKQVFDSLDELIEEMVEEDGLEVKLWLVDEEDVGEATTLARELGFKCIGSSETL